ncbi:DUF1295 domain-containing protein [Ramlibacter sp. PS3R-8]|uniref:DUF1295 domain-containing protein n=1 Tax=Ramlibacter sp. PS3R-8 TaxID=3133437 RepID=UPI0030A58C41
MPGIALLGLVPAIALAVAVWIASLPLRDASLADRAWALLVAAPAGVYAWQLASGWSVADRATWMFALLAVWAVRLTAHITWRNRGHGEDRRYAAMRQEHGPRFAVRSLFTVFLLQAVLAWVVSWPLLAGAGHPRGFGIWDLLGATLALFGIVFEAIADAQLARFRKDPANRGQVLQHGVWRWSRHPNYFGEACVWWGLACMAVAGGGISAAWSLASPLLMTVLLLKVSGVSLLEREIAGRRPGYADYVRRTSSFIPRPRKP